MRVDMPVETRIARWQLTLDLSGYLRAGFRYSIRGDLPRCEYVGESPQGANGRAALAPPCTLPAVEQESGIWRWRRDNVSGGAFRLAWELDYPDESGAFETANLDALGIELSVNPRLTKDLHNFVSVCQYYVLGLRSLTSIALKVIAHESVLRRSIESIESVIGADVVRRTKGRGVIEITPAGEAVLDWWSQFYMRWTPVSLESAELR
jgi:hypothetical protein